MNNEKQAKLPPLGPFSKIPLPPIRPEVKARIQLKTDSTKNWLSSKIPLLPGEAAVSYDSVDKNGIKSGYKLKFGQEGGRLWKDLPFLELDYSKIDVSKLDLKALYPILKTYISADFARKSDLDSIQKITKITQLSVVNIYNNITSITQEITNVEQKITKVEQKITQLSNIYNTNLSVFVKQNDLCAYVRDDTLPEKITSSITNNLGGVNSAITNLVTSSLTGETGLINKTMSSQVSSMVQNSFRVLSCGTCKEFNWEKQSK